MYYTGPYPEKNVGGGFGNGRVTAGDETETPNASRGWRMGRGVPLPSRLGDLGERRELPQWGETDLVHSTAVRKPLVAIILNILKCMFSTRKFNNSCQKNIFFWGGDPGNPPPPLNTALVWRQQHGHRNLAAMLIVSSVNPSSPKS